MDTTGIHSENAKDENSRDFIYRRANNIIINQLESGTVPWQQPWKDDCKTELRIPKNAVTGKNYRAINIVLLWSAAMSNRYTTQDWAGLKQWQKMEQRIRKGEKGNLVICYDNVEKEVEGELKNVPLLKHSIVFNRCQLEGYDPDAMQPEKTKTLDRKLEDAETFVAKTNAIIEHSNDGISYMPYLDKICMPKPSSFIDTRNCTATEGYYSELFHELTCWTRHPSRLDRKIRNNFGNALYAEEELTAELGAAFLAAGFGITMPDNPCPVEYISHLLHVLKQNKYCIFNAASEASKAVDYLHGLQSSKLVA